MRVNHSITVATAVPHPDGLIFRATHQLPCNHLAAMHSSFVPLENLLAAYNIHNGTGSMNCCGGLKDGSVVAGSADGIKVEGVGVEKT